MHRVTRYIGIIFLIYGLAVLSLSPNTAGSSFSIGFRMPLINSPNHGITVSLTGQFDLVFLASDNRTVIWSRDFNLLPFAQNNASADYVLTKITCRIRDNTSSPDQNSGLYAITYTLGISIEMIQPFQFNVDNISTGIKYVAGYHTVIISDAISIHLRRTLTRFADQKNMTNTVFRIFGYFALHLRNQLISREMFVYLKTEKVNLAFSSEKVPHISNPVVVKQNTIMTNGYIRYGITPLRYYSLFFLGLGSSMILYDITKSKRLKRM